MKITIAVMLVAGSACAATKRSPEMYRADTRKVLETRSSQITACYQKALATDPSLGGLVNVQFVVEKKTGKITQARLDPTTSAAPEPVVLCVLESIRGLALDPPDANEGRATFIYDLRPAS